MNALQHWTWRADPSSPGSGSGRKKRGSRDAELRLDPPLADPLRDAAYAGRYRAKRLYRMIMGVLTSLPAPLTEEPPREGVSQLTHLLGERFIDPRILDRWGQLARVALDLREAPGPWCPRCVNRALSAGGGLSQDQPGHSSGRGSLQDQPGHSSGRGSLQIWRVQLRGGIAHCPHCDAYWPPDVVEGVFSKAVLS